MRSKALLAAIAAIALSMSGTLALAEEADDAAEDVVEVSSDEDVAIEEEVEEEDVAIEEEIELAGDPAEGERQWRQCRSCHMITGDDGETIQRGGRVGPDLYGITNAPAASVEGFRYSNDLVAARGDGLIWTRENFIAYVEDPTGFLREFTGNNSARSSMNFQMRSGAEDVWAYLESLTE